MPATVLADGAAETALARTVLPTCEGGDLPASGKAKWRKKRNRLLTRNTSPRHMAEDAVAATGAKISLRAKLTYGAASKDLEGEAVDVMLHDCRRWIVIGHAVTDDDGWATVAHVAPAKAGVYSVVFRVKGDMSTAPAQLWVFPPKTRIAIFDIDGTLTTDDGQVRNEVLRDHFSKIGSGKHDPKQWPGGAELTRTVDRRGDVVVYLSGRPYWLIPHSRDWLEKHDFASGPLIHTRTHRQIASENVGVFKRDRILELKRSGFDVVEGYGNAATDVWAYNAAGIATASTWIIGPLAGKGGTNGVKGDWSAVTEAIQGPSTQKSSSD